VVADDLGMRMFFAEDEPILLEFVTRGHVEAGYAIETIVDGEDALFETSARRHGSR
jgi:DNA-binding response OmpR family regulator